MRPTQPSPLLVDASKSSYKTPPLIAPLRGIELKWERRTFYGRLISRYVTVLAMMTSAGHIIFGLIFSYFLYGLSVILNETFILYFVPIFLLLFGLVSLFATAMLRRSFADLVRKDRKMASSKVKNESEMERGALSVLGPVIRWNSWTTALGVTTLAFLISTFIYRNYLGDAIEGDFRSKLNKYGKGGDIKVMIDNYQLRYQCCGSNDYSNWKEIKWIKWNHDTKEILPEAVEKDFNEMDDPQRDMNGDFFVRGENVPWSCCSLTAAVTPCRNYDYANKRGTWSLNQDLGPEEQTINSQGCSSQISYPIMALFRYLIYFEVFHVLVLFAVGRFVNLIRTAVGSEYVERSKSPRGVWAGEASKKPQIKPASGEVK